MLDPESEASASLPLSDEERVDRLCDQFEAVHRNGQQPRIEAYLVQAPEVARDHLIGELIALELEWQRLAGTLPNIEAYRDRFPDRLPAIEAACKRAASLYADVSDISTTDSHGEHDTELEADDDEIPERIGRYAVEKELGRGGFAVVYMAHDTELNRKVALKVPRPDRFRSDRDMELFVEEARHAAGLDHPGIVRVHDVQREGNSVYIVQQYVPGEDLATFAKNHRFSPSEIAELMVGIAEAVGFAHQADLYHRDLKLANILVDEDARPHVADFGLAVHVSRQHEHRGQLAGSHPCMAPEQVRGEVHRLDGRTDIWGLGVILYELLARTRPFHGHDVAQLFDEIEHRDPRPPRQIDSAVPRELSRICLTCLAKRATDRYESTTDLIEDLRHWLDAEAAGASKPQAAADDPQQTDRQPPKIVPKGLRCFDAGDADFFLELLPGPRDRYGLPKSIRFWKTRIEETDPEETFSVGLIYGPSGCGKSSLVRAGLLPRLAEHVVPIYVEATAADTEVRLLKSVRRRCPDLPEHAALVELLSTLRDHGSAGGKKVLIVLDQFEQWLHAHTADDQSQLVDALRHCDGRNLQALVLVRDDFYRGVNRFFQALEERLVEGHNHALVDLFDPDHAKKVLTAFGQAYGKLAEADLTDEQTAFLDAAVTGLAEKGEVISVRLAVFAEMMKGKPWTVAALREVGGTEGVGVAFLEETFAARTAPPNYRLHEKGVRTVLQALLPELGTEIKGQMMSYERLLKASGYASSQDDFDALVDILDREVRLITPTEPDEDGRDADQATEQSAKHYQLSHDYLVPSLRRWLRQKETESYSGRARLRLADRTALWRSKSESQQLPPLWEYLDILALTRKRDWTEPQQRMMSAARWYYATRLAALATMLVVLTWGSREAFSRFKAKELVKSLMKAGPDKVVQSVAEIQPYLPWSEVDLQQSSALDAQTDDQRRQRLHARLALVRQDERQVKPLLESLLDATPAYIGVIREELSPYRAQISGKLWQVLHDESGVSSRRFRAGLALADYQRDSDQWQGTDYGFLVKQLLSSFAEHQPVFRRYLAPVASRCLADLEDKFKHAESSEQQTAAALAIKEFCPDDQQRIAQLLTVANPKQYGILFPLIEKNPDEDAMSMLAPIAGELPGDDLSSVDRLRFGQRRAGAGITLLRLGERESVLPTFEMTDDPEAMTQFIHRCRERGVRADELLELLRISCSSSLKPQASGVSRYALLLAIGEYSLDEIPPAERDQLLSDLADWYERDPSAGVHGAAGWLLRQWGQEDVVQRVDQTPVPYSSDREWFTLAITVKSPRREHAAPDSGAADEPSDSEANATTASEPSGESAGEENGEGPYSENAASNAADDEKATPSTDEEANGNNEEGPDNADERYREPKYTPQTLYFTFIVLQPGEYHIGSVDDEPDRSAGELPHLVKITRPIALLDREVSFAELIAFDPTHFTGTMNLPMIQAQPSDAGSTPNWYQSVEFCRWLTEQAGMSEAEQCYPSAEGLEKDKDGNPENWPLDFGKAGFRLPTEAEWEVACRAGMRTMYGQGADVSLLRHYAWYLENSEKHVHPPKTRQPGLRGMFDMHGNLFEWCHDWFGDYATENVVDCCGPDAGSSRVVRGGSRILGAVYCRSSFRGRNDPPSGSGNVGFRLALVPSARTPEAQKSRERRQSTP